MKLEAWQERIELPPDFSNPSPNVQYLPGLIHYTIDDIEVTETEWRTALERVREQMSAAYGIPSAALQPSEPAKSGYSLQELRERML